MERFWAQKEQRKAVRLVRVQGVCVGLLALVLGVLIDARAGVAVVLGGAVVVLPGALFARWVFAQRARDAVQMVWAFFVGEAVKLFVMAALFAALLWQLPGQGLPLFIGFIGALLAFWVAPFCCAQQEGA